MEYFRQIKEDLPKFSDDVIGQWLVPFSKDIGWPPRTDLSGGICGGWDGWYGILRGKNLDYCKNLDWRKEKIALTPYELVTKDLEMITSLISANVSNVPNIYSTPALKSKERFDGISCYIRKAGTFPKAVALEKLNDKYGLIDGCHRLASYFYLIGWFKVGGEDIPCLSVSREQEYWIAEQSTAHDFLSD